MGLKHCVSNHKFEFGGRGLGLGFRGEGEGSGFRVPGLLVYLMSKEDLDGRERSCCSDDGQQTCLIHFSLNYTGFRV